MFQTMFEVLSKSLFPLLVNYLPIIGVTIVLAWIITTQFCVKQDGDKGKQNTQSSHDTVSQKVDRKPVSTASTKPSKKKQHSEKWNRDTKQNFSHEWLLTSLKGHTEPILDMSFSANGKFLATCAEDDPGGTSGSSSGSEGNKENNSPVSRSQLSRRQKKNRFRKDDSSPGSKKKPKKQRHTVLRQYTKLNLNDSDLFSYLKNYTLSPQDLLNHGYPVESKLYPGRAILFKYDTRPFDVNAKEFIPRDDSVYATLLVPNCTESFDKKLEQPVRRIENTETSLEKKCVRCGKSFFISRDGEYLTQEHCMYHWGKMQKPLSGGGEIFYSCCKARKNTKGCTIGKLHVWSGIDSGKNGPFDGFVRTRPRKTPPPDGNFGIYSLDCEMCYTMFGLELTKITVVAHDGRLVYDTYVKPESFIIDYNTRFSGITAKDLAKKGTTKTLKDVQNDLMGFINADTILIGHGLENDLRALRIIHTTVVDTAVVFPHFRGLPFRRSLKSLASSILKRDIQIDSGGHDSFEDARSCLELILWKVRKDRIKDGID